MSTNTEDLSRPLVTRGWRVVDIVVAAVLGIAVGIIFWGWNGPGYSAFSWFDAVTPGLGGLMAGMWLLGGPLGGLVIRKPGAALLVEAVAAVVEMALGNIWGWSTLYEGIAQGLGAELVLALLRYRRWNVVVAMASGAVAGLGAWCYEFVTGNHLKSFTFNLTYGSCLAVSGAVLAGLLAWLLAWGLAVSGALTRFAINNDPRGTGRATSAGATGGSRR